MLLIAWSRRKRGTQRGAGAQPSVSGPRSGCIDQEELSLRRATEVDQQKRPLEKEPVHLVGAVDAVEGVAVG